MPVDYQHPQYSEHLEKCKRVRDAVAGQWAIHKAGTQYLPKLKDQSDDDYTAYRDRATYFNATGRTLDGLVGMVFRKEPTIEQAGIDSIIADVDLKNTSLASFSQSILRDVLASSRVGVLVEYPRVEQSPATQGQAQAMNLRPYASYYKTESIINWKESRINNVMQPVLIVLKESAELAKDEYESEQVEQWRELVLENGVYLQKIWQKQNNAKAPVLIETITPLMNGKALDFIPFYAFGSEENSLTPTDAPLLPLADLNIAHYRVTADYEHGCHTVGFPTPIIAADDHVSESLKRFYIGGGGYVLPKESTWGFLEFTGQGLGSLENNLEAKEKQMAAIGARMLEQQKRVAESEETYQMRTSGETSVLAGIAKLISAQLSTMFAFMAEWSGASGEVDIELNTDYMPTEMTPQQLTALVQTWQAGGITSRDLFDNLQRGEIISPAKNFEDHEEELDSQIPNLIS